MTEEQKKKCEEIYNSHIDFSHKIYAAILFLPKFVWVKITMLLAEVFNRDITEKEAEEIFDNINKNRQYSALNPINQSNYKDTFWRIANYFDKHFDNDNNKENENNE